MTRAFVAAFFCISVAAGPVVAEDKNPAPDYFVETIVATTTAENIALACPGLTFDVFRASQESETILAQLATDGFDAANLEATMADPSARIRDLQQAFLAKHRLPQQGADYKDVCAAGLAEIAEGTAIGTFLVEITGEGAVDPTKQAPSE